MGTLTGLFFTGSPVTNYAEAQQADHERYAHFFHAMLDRGVFLAPSGYETLFVSLAHDDETLETTIAAAREAAATLVRLTERAAQSSSLGRRLRRTWSRKNSDPAMHTITRTMTTKARPPEPSPSLPASTSC